MTTSLIIGEIILIFLGLVCFALLTLLLKYVIRKMYTSLKPKEVMNNRKAIFNPVNMDPNTGMVDKPKLQIYQNGVIRKYEYFEKPRVTGERLSGTSEGIPTDQNVRSTSVIIKKPERVAELSAMSEDNDFSRPYYSGKTEKAEKGKNVQKNKISP